MKLEEIEQMWAVDSHIDEFKLDDESLKIPKLHSKYYHMYIREKLALAKLREDQKKLEDVLIGFYSKTLTDEELEKYGLEYEDKKILKPDVPRAVACNNEMIQHNLKTAMVAEKVDFLKSIIQQIGNRSFIIKDAIQFKIFQAGG